MKYKFYGVKRLGIYLTILLTVFLNSCQQTQKRYVIGVSQCSEDIWRHKLNYELQLGSYYYEDVELRLASADDNDERQVQQINQFVDEGIDLLIVAPNQIATITPAIDRAYDKGIPVIVFDRKTSSRKYTAFIGADNYEMGNVMGKFIATRLHGKGTVLEVMGLKGSSPAIDRHRGFADALKEYPQIHVVASLQGDWTEKSAVEAIKNYRGDLSQVDFVFGQNDRMAVGASKVLSEKYPSSPILYCGIDGLPGKGNGVECVRDSILEASYIYPTRGDEVLQLAMNILEGKPYKKENLLMAAMVTRDNAHVVLMQSEEAVRQAKYLDRLHDKIDETLQVLGTQKVYVISLIVVIVLLAVTFILLYLYFLQRSRIREEREQMARSQLDFYTKASHQLRTPLTLISGPVEKLKNLLDTQSTSEASTLIHIVDRNTQELEKLVNDILQGGEQDDQLPMVDEMSDAETIATLPSEDDSGEPVSILIVDDNDDIRTYLRTILQERYQVEEAADGQLGLEKARQTVPDLIISDVMMPVMNGLEFCQKVKTEVTTSHIPVILLTARALYQHQIEGYRHGADAYITKPFQSSLLLARIDNLLRNRHLLRNIWSSQDIEKKEHRATPQQDSRENAFIEKFKMVVEAKMADSDLGVEEIASDMNLSRVQLYRKVKALTGSSPVELMRKARLSKAYRLLLSGDKNISEVAYEVGFSAPSYFTKCFKDEFGVLPGDVRSRM